MGSGTQDLIEKAAQTAETATKSGATNRTTLLKETAPSLALAFMSFMAFGSDRHACKPISTLLARMGAYCVSGVGSFFAAVQMKLILRTHRFKVRSPAGTRQTDTQFSNAIAPPLFGTLHVRRDLETLYKKGEIFYPRAAGFLIPLLPISPGFLTARFWECYFSKT
ncbi:hypothetical protein FGG08_005734 [Glutinoglossum americanum]|uniref:Uncharacterized protein n=1 Tax=Glutinoglossum americanum TaxID=1670608 RepID=A0A9P8HXU8_9PEZI|nr:hypothetical protein FGG08_005734 [Glutinoglossum americanum]